MSSPERRPAFDLGRDLPTTARDTAAQKRLRRVQPDDPWRALQQLHDALPPAARSARRSTARGRRPFEI